MNLFQPTYVFKSIHDIDDDFFKREKISLVLLDIDNTLVPDNQPEADEGAVRFINRLKAENVGICLVSNNKKSRVDSFNRSFALKSIYRAAKPLPYKLNRVIWEEGAEKEKVLFIGDQLLTDILAANACGIRSVLVDPINVGRENLFFKFKRFIEKRIIKRNFI